MRIKIYIWLNRLANHWQLKSSGQVLIILVVFAMTGFSAMYAKKFVFAFLGIQAATHWLVKVSVWMITILPVYQLILLFYGALFGQFEFFWTFEKRMFAKIFSGFHYIFKKIFR